MSEELLLSAVALAGGFASIAVAAWTLIRERLRARQVLGQEGRITITVGDGSEITLDASDFSHEDLQAVLEALEDAHYMHHQKNQDV